MPLRDHFRPPLDDVHSWDELHGGWPMVIVQHLIEVLPEPYFAAPGVHLGTLYEVDVGTYKEPGAESNSVQTGNGNVATATYAPPQPTLTLEPRLPDQDVYEVRIFDRSRNRRLVAAIEIVSPSNKDRPETRATFVSKLAALLKHDVCVTIVNVVSTNRFNLYSELLSFVSSQDPALGEIPPAMYAATLRLRRQDRSRMMDSWFHSLEVGRVLPTLPIWIQENQAVPLELETTYEATCRALRIR